MLRKYFFGMLALTGACFSSGYRVNPQELRHILNIPQNQTICENKKIENLDKNILNKIQSGEETLFSSEDFIKIMHLWHDTPDLEKIFKEENDNHQHLSLDLEKVVLKLTHFDDAKYFIENKEVSKRLKDLFKKIDGMNFFQIRHLIKEINPHIDLKFSVNRMEERMPSIKRSLEKIKYYYLEIKKIKIKYNQASTLINLIEKFERTNSRRALDLAFLIIKTLLPKLTKNSDLSDYNHLELNFLQEKKIILEKLIDYKDGFIEKKFSFKSEIESKKRLITKEKFNIQKELELELLNEIKIEYLKKIIDKNYN